VSRYATSGSVRSGVSRSYEEYLQSVRPAPYPAYPSHYAPPRGGYESRSSYDNYSYGGRSPPPMSHDRRAYDRSVEEFLRRTSERPSSHGDRYRRYDRR
jgi:hypothetical protein